MTGKEKFLKGVFLEVEDPANMSRILESYRKYKVEITASPISMEVIDANLCLISFNHFNIFAGAHCTLIFSRNKVNVLSTEVLNFT